MSMALALEFAQEYLRGKNNWQPNECGVQYDALPPNEAGQFYVAIDDSGVETGPDTTSSLREILTITIGIWRRPEHLSLKDRKGLLKLPVDKYLLGAYTIHDLERAVILPRLNGLHQNWKFVNELNTKYELPHPEYGDKFFLPFVYRGRGRMETVGNDTETGAVVAWYGYRLRFRGLAREQSMSANCYTG